MAWQQMKTGQANSCSIKVPLCADKPRTFYDDILKRRPEEMPEFDVYTCGFPCQPYSSIGGRKGWSDGRSRVLHFDCNGKISGDL